MAGCGGSQSPDSARFDLGGRGLAFYDWEANLRGPARILASNARSDVGLEVLNAQRRKWIENGRSPGAGLNRHLVMTGAEPTRRDANRVAASVNRAGKAAQGTVVLEVQAADPATGVPSEPKHAGFFVLNDDPALTGDDIEDATLDWDADDRPIVTFLFTKRGHIAFQRLTRKVSARGRYRALNCGRVCTAELVLQRFAITFDDQVLELHPIDYFDYPDGYDGNTGFQISGNFDEDEARELVSILRDDS